MKYTITMLLFILLSGCQKSNISIPDLTAMLKLNSPKETVEKKNTKTDLKTTQVQKLEPKEEFERTISYQDIIVKINNINTKNKNNIRIKEIVKEYQYNTSDDDSKNSARKKALNQVKLLILEEIGVFVEGYLELNKVVENEKYQKYFKQEIKNLTAGIIKTRILDERYDGKTYYVKASVLVDPDSVSEGISEILKIKANKSEINKLTKLLKSKEQEIDMRSSETIKLQKKITKQMLINQAKEEELKLIHQVKSEELKLTQIKLQKKITNQASINQAKVEELKLIQKKLLIAEGQLQKYNIKENKIRTKLNKILNRINTETYNVRNKISLGMTSNEVIQLMGLPNSTSNCAEGLFYNYGKVWVVFKEKIAYTLLDHSSYRGPCYISSY